MQCVSQFLYWKKLYYKYKCGRCSESGQFVSSLMWNKIWRGGFPNPSLDCITIPIVRYVIYTCSNYTVRAKKSSGVIWSGHTQIIYSTSTVSVWCSYVLSMTLQGFVEVIQCGMVKPRTAQHAFFQLRLHPLLLVTLPCFLSSAPCEHSGGIV